MAGKRSWNSLPNVTGYRTSVRAGDGMVCSGSVTRETRETWKRTKTGDRTRQSAPLLSFPWQWRDRDFHRRDTAHASFSRHWCLIAERLGREREGRGQRREERGKEQEGEGAESRETRAKGVCTRIIATSFSVPFVLFAFFVFCFFL